ncbi:MAG TPA: hypothetical protein VL285_13205 [Bryobacteraceae bacterium]|jgi:hypothetical protein|nr:hypothetical protein [Bryobacteraceae bacterium]
MRPNTSKRLLGTVLKTALILFASASSAVYAHNLRICKAADSVGPVTGTFHFTVVGQQGTTDVPVGNCVTLNDLGIGQFTVIEQASAGVTVNGITVDPAVNIVTSDTQARSATVTIVDGGTTTVTFTNRTNSSAGRFTGGGSIFTAAGARVTHGFELHCDVIEKPNNLEINWNGNQFHLDSLTTASCSTNPQTGISTLVGSGTGRYNRGPGATIEFTITDAGEPGVNDFFSCLIGDAGGNTVLSASGNLRNGNQQFHPK